MLVYSSRVPGGFADVSTACRCICNSKGLPVLWTDAAVILNFLDLCCLHNNVAVNALGSPAVLTAYNCVCNSEV